MRSCRCDWQRDQTILIWCIQTQKTYSCTCVARHYTTAPVRWLQPSGGGGGGGSAAGVREAVAFGSGADDDDTLAELAHDAVVSEASSIREASRVGGHNNAAWRMQQRDTATIGGGGGRLWGGGTASTRHSIVSIRAWTAMDTDAVLSRALAATLRLGYCIVDYELHVLGVAHGMGVSPSPAASMVIATSTAAAGQGQGGQEGDPSAGSSRAQNDRSAAAAATAATAATTTAAVGGNNNNNNKNNQPSVIAVVVSVLEARGMMPHRQQQHQQQRQQQLLRQQREHPQRSSQQQRPGHLLPQWRVVASVVECPLGRLPPPPPRWGGGLFMTSRKQPRVTPFLYFSFVLATSASSFQLDGKKSRSLCSTRPHSLAASQPSSHLTSRLLYSVEVVQPPQPNAGGRQAHGPTSSHGLAAHSQSQSQSQSRAGGSAPPATSRAIALARARLAARGLATRAVILSSIAPEINTVAKENSASLAPGVEP